jgi:hypothetical protein
VFAAHLKGEVHIGLYPLLDGDRCRWLAADFDGPDALADALMYVKAARALQVPVALEVSRSGVGAHAWMFFTSPVPAETARRLGTGLLREAMATRGRMKLDSYDRLFPSQDLLPAGGIGNLIAAPLFKPARRNGATMFLNLEDLEPHKDQWRYLSTLGRMTPQEVKRAADRAGRVAVAAEVTKLGAPFSSQIRPPAAPVLHVRLGAGIGSSRLNSPRPWRRRCGTRPRCIIRSSTSGSGCAPPHTTSRGFCTALTKPSTAA